jgi:AraC-like DNA-binding protein
MQELIKSSLDYIEQNLKTDITVDELADMAGYSVGHYYRLFSQVMDSSVANYILKKRLEHALDEIAAGKKAIGVVLEYGFDTYSGFYKAFVRMYGCSPKKYISIYKKSEVLIMHSEKDIRKILENWVLPAGLKIEDASVKDWETGNVNWTVWQIGDEYYLKTNERSKMVRNIKIAKAMQKESLSSEFLPIPTKSGGDYLDGEHIYLLTKKIGRPMNMRPLTDDEIGVLENNEIRAKYAFQLGRGIAKLHKALKSVQDDVTPDEDKWIEYVLSVIPKVKEYCIKKNMGISDEFFDDYIKTFGGLHEKLPKQLIHGNPVGDSAVYAENGDVVCIKGYEYSNVSRIRLFDVIWCAGEVNAQPSFELYLKTFKEIIRGYDSINPFTAEEKQSFYYVICSTYMGGIDYFDESLDISGREDRAFVFIAKNKDKFSNLI